MSTTVTPLNRSTVSLPESSTEMRDLRSSAASHQSQQSEVDVERGVQHFRNLQKDLQSSVADASKSKDLEKGAPEFDLQTYFEESIRMDEKRGSKAKQMGVVVKDLTVVGQGYDASSISDNTTPLVTLAKLLWPPNWFHRSVGSKFDILHEVSAFCKDGEMLLVLGRPGAGCSTFLRVITNQRSTYLDITGEILYGGISAKEFERYSGEAIYAPEEDIHYATLSVEDTLDFALKMKTPGNLLPEEKKRDFRTRVLDGLLNMFGLVKQRHTIAGNEFVRGLSGGERKRLTISEAMASQGAIECWDCSTRGLDAASALDYAKSLRITTDTLNKTTIATFYQASESIYKLFDRVLVLEKGKCIYFGPTSEAKQYFVDLGFDCEPRKSTPDFLTGITNPQERIIRSGFENSAPTTSAALEKAWKASQNYQNSQTAAANYEKELESEKPAETFKQQVRANKAKGQRKKSQHTANYWQQVRALAVRQGKIFLGNRFNIFTRYLSVIIQALLYGSAFYQMPLTSTGVFTRGGAIFASILFNSFISIAEMAGSFLGRPILEKQKSYAFYSPSAFYLAQVLLDIPILLVQVVLWTVIAYFMFGFDLVAGKFFIYLFGLYITALTIVQLFRLLAIPSKSMYVSQQVLAVILILLLVYTGYSLPVRSMHPWLKWVYYINPFGYAFKGLFSNEMTGLVFDCSSGVGAIPAGPGYDDPLYRVCALPGSAPGGTQVLGDTFLYEQYSFNTSDRALDFIIVFCFFIGFTLINCIIIEFMDYSGGGYTRKVFKRGKAPKNNDSQAEEAQAAQVMEANENLDKTLTMSGGIFMWKDIVYSVPVPKEGKRVLLQNVEGWIKPGQMTALMGASGAGKTTLLDVLAQRKTIGQVEGEMLLNGKPLQKDFERITGYVEQMDVFNGYITVREALQFSAKLRQEPSVPLQDKLDYVERVLEMMEMSHLGDAIIGSLATGTGISVEERKRLTIGMELVAKPHILFLDEPTSGLDSQSAYNIIKFIRKLADAGMPLVCTIHQPSPVLFEFFDRLLLLAKGGKTVYFGDIGERSRVLLNYFEERGARTCDESENPAEYILEAIGAGVGGKTNVDWVDQWQKSHERENVHLELEKIEQDFKLKVEKSEEEPREFATSIPYQTKLVYQHFNRVWWRNPSYNFGRLLNAVAVGLIIGFSFWDLGDTPRDLQSRILAIFQILILGIMLIVAALPQFSYLRDLFRRDYASKFYSSIPFSLALILVDLPYVALAGTLCVVSVYWTAGLNSTPLEGFYFWLMFTVFFYFCISFGQLMGALSPNVGIAMIILPIFNTFLFLFAGVLAPPKTLPTFWYYWWYWLNPFHWFLEGVVTNVFKSLVIKCEPIDFFRFNPPPGQTCGEYSQNFLNAAPGYLENPNATSLCEYCPYKAGSEYYEQNEWSYDSRWRNLGILIGYWVFNVVVSSALIYLFRKGKR
eukprot:TRINITY_DN2879_c0_g1_i1.p1 TRINITY_DN2879_c0_g1~~TRINITY_DN2879_c0_g1_i1.p1  ORF type:complete len:1443 (-),score=460.96 TRINITY_DN2879_c0_g1_i1:56-4384(-)